MTEEHADIAAKICIGFLFLVTMPIWIPVVLCITIVGFLYTIGEALCDISNDAKHRKYNKNELPW